MGELGTVDGADWDQEIGAVAHCNLLRNKPLSLLFDNVRGYPTGYRLLTCTLSSANRVAATLGLPSGLSELDLISGLRGKLVEWRARLDRFPPETVRTGRLLENVHQGADVDLMQFPSPRWHELDGGRYMGTANAVITRDPDTGVVNFGTYRNMVHDNKTAGFYISPGKHGRLHQEKWHALGKACPVAISMGHHPAFFVSASTQLPAGAEYLFTGAVLREPVKVITEEVTGLPVPADSEIVISGFSPPNQTRLEGPFGEWTGYYASKESPAPYIQVERIYHRNNPILLGSHNDIPPGDSTYYGTVMASAQLFTEMVDAGIPDIAGVWSYPEIGGPLWMVISIKQRYAGHARQAALLASQSRVGAYHGRYVIVVDEDIDPSNLQEVLWAICTRSDPEKDIDLLRRCWSTPLDPTIRRPTDAYFNSRAILGACKPFEWKSEFPQEIRISAELQKRVNEKWGI